MATLSNGEIFRKAADYIREHGFSLLPGPPGWRWELGGPVCAEGALLAICGISSEGAASAPLPCAPAHPTIHIAAVRAGETVRVFGREEPRLWKWSDKPGRTAEEVISLFEGLAADEELKEQVAAFDEDLKAAATAGNEVDAPAVLLQNLPEMTGIEPAWTPAQSAGHKSLDVVKEWIGGSVLKITYEGCERRKCGYERVPA